MTRTLAERILRAGLPLIRLSQTLIPLSPGNRFLRWGVKYALPGAGVLRESVSANGVPCEWLIPREIKPDRVLLYLHGGGYVYGLTPPHIRMGAWLARRTGLRVLMVDYRLAPEHPFPAALEDCVAAYRWLLEQGYQPNEILVAGDSAGGNLAITLALKLRAEGVGLPAAIACLSPVTDLSPQSNRQANFKDPMLPASAIRFYTESYLGQHDPRDPLISPVYAELRGLPPLLIHVGELETLRADAVRLAGLAKEAGVDVSLEVFPRMWHVWQIFPQLPQAQRSLEEIAQFFLDRRAAFQAAS